MALKNYTSQVSATRSINYIEAQLVKHGARTVVKIYDDDKKITGIWFVMNIDGKEIPFKLPSRVEACETILKNNLGPRTRRETFKKIPKQAERTAWKILSDWVEAQMAMVELAQIEIAEIFLPYIYDQKADQTFFEKIKKNQYRNLLEWQ